MTSWRRLLLSLVLILSASVSDAQKSPASENDLKKQAEKLFEKESYVDAAPMYSQLLSLYPREAIYNYRYGVCLLMSGQDKTGAASYLETAAKVKETDPDVYFYLGRSYMFMDRFNEAINAFTVFKKQSPLSKQNKLQPDVYIHNCENANELRKDRKNVVVLNKTKINRSTFFAAYDFTEAAGKLLTTPDRFLSPLDKQKMSNPVMFMTKDGETIYYASYGKKGDHGKDIYRIVKSQNGVWSEPVNLSDAINSDANEDYPYLDKDGRTLYFSSNGHNSIGGYDVFKSQYDFNTGKWSDPVNVGIPINTVDDDIFYMPSTKGETAVYSTAVECETGRIEMRNIKLGDVVNNLAVISGKYFSQDQVTRRDARITVIRTRDNGVVTSVKTDRTGDYELVLPTGDEYMLIVEGGSYVPHAENFSVPQGLSVSGLKQRVTMNKAGDTEEMTMSNYFTPSANDASTATLEKPSQVAKSEFDIKDTASSKMQPITFDGKTLFVAPPSLKNFGGPDIDAAAFNNKKEDTAISAEANAPEDTLNLLDTDSDEEAVKSETKNENGITVENKSAPVISDKTSNAELVKMAFEDAQSIKEEAKSLYESAEEKRTESKSLDSLSKVQVKEANSLLTSGDKEQSQQLFGESQQNALDALQKNKEAQSIESDARQKDVESEKANQEAAQFMKEFKVDTSAYAYHSISGKGTGKSATHVANSEKGKTPVETGSSSASQNNIPGTSHSEKASKLAEEAGNLILSSLDMEHRAEKATDKTHKDFYEKKSKDLKHQSEIKKAESEKESALAVSANEEPVAVHSGNGIASDSSVTSQEQGNAGVDSKNNSVENISSNQTGEKKTSGNESDVNKANEDHPETIKTADKAQQENPGTTSASSKEVQHEGAGNDIAENKKTVTADSIGNPATEKTPLSQQKNSDAVAMKEKEAVHSTTENNASGKETPGGTKSNADSVLGEKHIQQQNAEPVAMNEKNDRDKTAPVTEPKNADDAGVKTTTAETKPRPVLNVKVDPLAMTHYQNYRQRLSDSKKTENASKETEAKLLMSNSKEKRDSITAKTTELNLQSIRQWQEAQKELTAAKEIDPEIEGTLQNIPDADIASINETATNNSTASTGGKPTADNITEDRKAGETENAIVQPANKPGHETTAEVLDTTKPEYPKYIATNKEILQKQTETVNLFVEGMKLNKKAVAIKADEMKLRDQAEVSTDKKEKEKLVEKADSLAMEAEIVTNHSKEMLAVAQKNTGAVKELTAKSEQLKSGLVVNEKPQATQQTATSAGSPSGTSANPTTNTTQPAGVNPSAENSSSKPLTAVDKTTSSDSTGNQQLAENNAGNIQPAVNTNDKSSTEAATETPSGKKAVENNPGTSQPIGNANDNSSPAATSDSTAAKPVAENPGNAAKPVSNTKDISSPATAGNSPAQNKIDNESATTGAASQPSTAENQGATSGNTQPVSPVSSSADKTNAVQSPTALNQTAVEKENQPVVNSGSELNFESKISDDVTFSLSKGDAYSDAHPIPMDPALPEGLVFKVQIGAFHQPLPANTFKNLQPLSGETTRPGWIRYCLGLFKTFEPANLLKKEVRSMGYRDAFVVAYFNGKRIPLYDAYTMISKANTAQKQTYASVSEKEFSHLSKFEIVKSSFDNKPDEDTKAFYGTVEKVSAELVEYAVQVGVYKSSRTPSALNSLLPLNSEQMNSGLFRFTTGRFDNRAAADSMKRIAVSSGVKDAFVVIYKGGKKAGQLEAQKIITAAREAAPKQGNTPGNISVNNAGNTSATGTPSSATIPISSVAVPVNADDVVFKIQLGAFKENVPFNTVSSYLSIADKGISQETDARGLHIFYAGQYKNYNESVTARDEIVSKGVKDAFIVAFVKGRRTTATEALKLLNGK